MAIATFITGQPWLPAVVALISAWLVTRQIRAIRRRNEFDVLEKARERLDTAFGVHGDASKVTETRYYDLRDRFRTDPGGPNVASGQAWGREARLGGLRARVELVSQLSKSQRDKDLNLLRPDVEALNDVAVLRAKRRQEATLKSLRDQMVSTDPR